MEYQRIVDDLRRKAEELHLAADTIEAVYLTGTEQGQDAARPPQRWAPGRGAPDPPAEPEAALSTPVTPAPKPKPGRPTLAKNRGRAPVKQVAPRRPPPVQAPAETVAETESATTFDKPTKRQVVDAIKQMITMGIEKRGHEILVKTVINWCATMGIGASPEAVEDAIELAKREIAA